MSNACPHPTEYWTLQWTLVTSAATQSLSHNRSRYVLMHYVRNLTIPMTYSSKGAFGTDRIHFSRFITMQCLQTCVTIYHVAHGDVIKWKHFPALLAFVRGMHRSPVNSPHKGQWRGALMFALICAWINDRVNNREAGDLRRHRAHYDVTVIQGAIVWATSLVPSYGFQVSAIRLKVWHP